MKNTFKEGKMLSNVADSYLANAIFKAEEDLAPVIDGALVVLGDLIKDTTYAADGVEYDTYEAKAPQAAGDEVVIVDYAGISQGEITGNVYKMGSKLYGLKAPAGEIVRVRRLALHDKFWLGEGNFEGAPVVGQYAIATANKVTHTPNAEKQAGQYCVKIIDSKDFTVGMKNNGKLYLCEVVALNDKKALVQIQKLEKQSAEIFKELKKDNSVSNYLSANTDAFMKAAGISKEDEVQNISKVLYDKLQSGDVISVQMSDGANVIFGGHFSDETGRWRFELNCELSKEASKAMFPKDSVYSVLSGNIKIIMEPAEATKYGEYGGCILVYGYSIDMNNVIVSDGESEYLINIQGLNRPEDVFDPCLIIDPNKEQWTVTAHEFKLPEEDAQGVIKINGRVLQWKNIKQLL